MIFNAFCPDAEDGLHWFKEYWPYPDAAGYKCDFCEIYVPDYEAVNLVNAAAALTGRRARIAAGLLRHMVGDSTKVHQDALEEFARRLLSDEF